MVLGWRGGVACFVGHKNYCTAISVLLCVPFNCITEEVQQSYHALHHAVHRQMALDGSIDLQGIKRVLVGCLSSVALDPLSRVGNRVQLGNREHTYICTSHTAYSILCMHGCPR